MTTVRTRPARRCPRSGRRALIALLTGAGVMLTPLTEAAAVAASSSAAQAAVNTAMAQLGDPFAWGGAGPNSFDCSGLTQFAYRAAGIRLPHSSRMQSIVGVPVSRANLRPGDLVFFFSPVRHVAIYIGNGKIVHAPTRGDVVRVAWIDQMPYHSARRVA